MGLGSVGLQTSQKKEQSGPPFVATAAENGLSVNSITGRIVFGNDVAATGNPAALLSNREILAASFTARLINTATSPTNILRMGAGLLTINTTNLESPLFNTNIITDDTIFGGAFQRTTLVFSAAFLTSNTFDGGQKCRVVFNTVTGVTLTTNNDNPKPAYYGSLDFRNVVPATPNAIAIGGPTATVSVFFSKVDLGNSANNNKTITGTIAGYKTLLDMASGVVGTLDSYVDFLAGALKQSGGGFTATNRYGFFVSTLLSAANVTNRWGFYQQGTSDRNFLAGFTGFATPTDIPSARVHIGAGTAAAGTALMKWVAGVVLTATEVGAWEWNGTNVLFTDAAAVRQNVYMGNDGAAAPGTTAGVLINNFYGTAATNYLGTPNSWASVTINGTAYKIPLYT